MTNVKSNFKTMHMDMSCDYCDKGVTQTDDRIEFTVDIVDFDATRSRRT